MIFPLYRCPATVAFLDDDEAWVEMLADVMPEHWPVTLYLHPADCISRLRLQAPLQESLVWQQRDMIDRWREGRPLVPQILQYWQQDPAARYGLTQVCVVDYSMPAMNGLQALEQLSPWVGARILLTGRADEQIAVDAFNQGLIEQYIPKQVDGIAHKLTQTIQRMLDAPRPEQALIWRSTLSREQLQLLAAPGVADGLAACLANHRLVEYFVLGDPFGVLALDADGQAFWLQLERPDRVEELAELAACRSIGNAEIEEIRQGRKLVDIEFRQSLGLDEPAWAATIRLGESPGLLAGLFRVPPQLCPGTSRGYRSYLRACGPREPVELTSLD